MATEHRRGPAQLRARPAPSPAPARSARRSPLRGSLTGGGTDGNELLTAATGAALIVLLAALGITILRIGQLLWLHLFLGMLLIGPVALKLASTGYRFTRYYTRNPGYRLKGPPFAPLRMIAPVIVLTTLLVFASGVALLFVGPSSRGVLVPIHKVSFLVWIAFTAPHVLAHLIELPRAWRADYMRTSHGVRLTGDVTGRAGRVLALAGALAAGALIAILVIPEFGAWTHDYALHHHHLR